MKAGTTIFIAILMMMPAVGAAAPSPTPTSPSEVLRAAPALWTCSVVCTQIKAGQFSLAGKKTGLSRVKEIKENDPTLSKINLWPIGYRIKLDRAGAGAPVSSGYSYSCDASGSTPQEAMKALGSRLTGKGLSIVAIPCRGCQGVTIGEAICMDTRTQREYPYSVLQSRMNPKAVIEAPASSVDSAR